MIINFIHISNNNESLFILLLGFYIIGESDNCICYPFNQIKVSIFTKINNQIVLLVITLFSKLETCTRTIFENMFKK